MGQAATGGHVVIVCVCDIMMFKPCIMSKALINIIYIHIGLDSVLVISTRLGY